MKPIFVFVFLLIALNGIGQIPSQIQAKRGVFTERLFLKDKWIDRISTDLIADSTSDNILPTANAVRRATGSYIKNQFSEAQQASFRMQGLGVIGPFTSFRTTLSGGSPANAFITQGSSQYGLTIQQASGDNKPADLVLFKNNATNFNSLNALQFGDPIGSINFSGITGDNNTLSSPMSIYGFVEKTAPNYLSSGFIFHTTDSNGTSARRMGINAQGNLMIGNATINPYKLNVAAGDTRFHMLADPDWLDVLVGADNDGKVAKVIPDYYLYLQEGVLYAEPPQSNRQYVRYLATLTQTGTNNPVVTVLENSLGATIIWTRDSAGHYTGTADGFFNSQNWFHSYPADPSGNMLRTRVYRTSNDTIKLEVKDAAMANKDGWSQVTVEVILYLLG